MNPIECDTCEGRGYLVPSAEECEDCDGRGYTFTEDTEEAGE